MDRNICFLMCFIYAAAYAVDNDNNDSVDVLKPDTKYPPGETLENHLIRRLEANENLIHHLLESVNYLEARVKTHTAEINDLNENLADEKRRSSMLENVCRHQLAKEKDPGDLHTEVEPNSRDGTLTKTDANTGRIRRANNEYKVAFSAGITQHVNHAGVNQTYIFDHALTNIGKAYNTHNGNFVAPIGGTYVFSVTLMSLYHNNAHARFYKNGQPITWMYVSGAEAGYDTTSQTVVLQLQQGDDVSVRNTDNDVSMAGNHFSLFSGFLLYEATAESVIVGK